MDKVFASPAEAIADLSDGACIAVSGFGPSAGVPFSLMAALDESGKRDLCLAGNGTTGANRLIEEGRVSRLICSFVGRPGTPVGEQILQGKITYEVVPQGTLVERMRAGGAGLAAIYTPTGVDTPIGNGKEIREFNGRRYLLEPALHVDYAFIAAHRADKLGNLEFRGSNTHFAHSFAKAARITIAEVDEIVEVGDIPPDHVGLAGIFVQRVVKKTVKPEIPTYGLRRRGAETAKTYNGKPAWTRIQMAERAAARLPDHAYVNLGLGIPTFVSNFLNGRDIILHGENGLLGYGEILPSEQADRDVFSAGGQNVASPPGISFFDSVTAFEMVRSGRVDVVVLGAYQVDEAASVANWSTAESEEDMIGGGIGGAMDLVAGRTTVMIILEHRDSQDRPKLVKQCTYPLTGKGCVSIVVTDLCVMIRRDDRWVVEEVAPGFTPREVLALAELDADVSPNLATPA